MSNQVDSRSDVTSPSSLGPSLQRRRDVPYRLLLTVFMVVAAVVMAGFIGVIIQQSIPAWEQVGFKFFTNRDWILGSQYGLLPLVGGTLETTGLALLLAVPIGIGSATAIVFFAPNSLRLLLSSVVAVLAIVPSVIFGVWASLTLEHWAGSSAEPYLTKLFHGHWPFSGFPWAGGIMVASITLAVMILPIITAVAIDVFAALPEELIEGALALGATRSHLIWKVIWPTCRSGLVGAVSLGTARAMGETIALVTILGAPSVGVVPASLFANGQTLATTIISANTGSYLGFHVIDCLALVLLVVVGLVVLLARSIVNKNIRRFS